MSAAGDRAGRLRALTDLGSSLVVEAAAGTGKTSLLAGRVAFMLADGIPPDAIVAITFTEQAAGELAGRIRSLVEALLAGRVPEALSDALPFGLPPDRRMRLEAAAARLDELTASTIHGFCHALIRDHAIAADVDPGAEIMDAEAAAVAFERVFDGWLRRRLDGTRDDDDPVVVLSRADPRGVSKLLRGLAEFRRARPSATSPPADLSGRPDLDFADAVDGFRRWVAAAPPHGETRTMARSLDELAAFYADAFATPPGFAKLWMLAHPPRVASMPKDHGRKESLELRPLCDREGWRDICGETEGERLFEEAARLCEGAIAAFAALLGRVAGALAAIACAQLDEALADWRAAKRAAARIDFGDLLETARALLRDDDDVRRTAAARYRHVLVDEFQDIDPVQAEIVLRLTAREAARTWRDCVPREGALFVVADPKQSIYRFRGADASVYLEARDALLARSPANLVEISANWRSRPGVCAYVNRCFSGPLSRPPQPRYVPIEATRDDPVHGGPCACRLPLALAPDANAATIREVEADAVAATCARLVGAMEVEDRDGAVRALAAGDIALLAPTVTDLWRYERALRRHGLRAASHAGKAFHRRQEVQDLLALTRVLADPRDTLAFGALLRGPLVGATDEALLDVAERLHALHGDQPRRRFTVSTEVGEIGDPDLARVVSILRRLRQAAGSTSPHAILSRAVAELDVRTLVAIRDGHAAEGALANVDAFLDMSRGYAVRGLGRFARDLDRAWRERAKRAEGRVDAGRDAVSLVTMHAAKGMEWGVTIPINAGSEPPARPTFLHRPQDDTLHWMLGGVAPPSLTEVLRETDMAEARERERLWYVAATRARELVIVPEIRCASSRSWARVVDLGHSHLPVFTEGWLNPPSNPPQVNVESLQDAAAFAAETSRIAAATPSLRWLRPSAGDLDRMPDTEDVEEGDTLDVTSRAPVVGAGRARGLVLHALIEEALDGRIVEAEADVSRRASELLLQLGDAAGIGALPEASELARTCLATLRLPEVAAVRSRLVAEFAVRGVIDVDGVDRHVDGRADAVVLGSRGVEGVFDWKSDVDPAPAEREAHRKQMRMYLAVTGASWGLIVYITTGRIDRVVARAASGRATLYCGKIGGGFP